MCYNGNRNRFSATEGVTVPASVQVNTRKLENNGDSKFDKVGRNTDILGVPANGWDRGFDRLHIHQHDKEGLLHIGLHSRCECGLAEDFPLPLDQLHNVHSHFAEDDLCNIFGHNGLNNGGVLL